MPEMEWTALAEIGIAVGTAGERDEWAREVDLFITRTCEQQIMTSASYIYLIHIY
jgi:hypothetical protein